LINFAGSMADVDAYLEKTFALLLAAAPEAVRESKKLHHSYSPISWKQVRPKVTKLIAARRVSKEGQKGLQAFFDKRSPNWSDDGSPAQI
jgi:methylglutaconyl-CoA hydratase